MRELLTKASVCVLLGGLMPISLLRGQVITAQISGDVTDSSHAAIQNAKVVAKNLDTGIERTAVTNEHGHYALFALPLGPYSLTAQVAGFKPIVRERMTLSIDQQVIVDFSLKPADVTETVTVAEEAPLINTTTAETGKTIKTAAIDTLPLNGRDYSQLATLVPGVRQAGSSTTIMLSGQAYTSSSFKVDGMDNDSEWVSGRQAKYTQDAIAEVQVLTSQFLPEFGRSAGGVVSIITRSGTNEFHGRGWYYGREDAMDGRNALAVSKPPFERKQFGGTFGGPIIREKTFFFGSIERLAEDNQTVIVTPGLTENFPVPSRGLTVFGKVNHQLTDKHSLQISYNYDRLFTGGQAVGGIQLPDHSFTRGSTQNNVIFGDTWLVGPRTVNELRVQFQRREAGNVPDMPGRPEIDRPSTISGTPTSTPAVWNENKISFSEALTHNFNAAGSHSLKFGTQIQLIRGDTLVEQFDTGRFIFATDKPFNAADPTTYPTQYDHTSGSPDTTMDNNVYSFHINDEWRPVNRLTLNLGLRYDNESGPLVRVFPSANANIAPRLSFAWSPTAGRKWVIRGGYGRFYYRLYGNLGTNLILAGAPPPIGIGVRTNLTIINPGYPDPLGFNPNTTSVTTPLKSGAISNGKEQSPYSDDLSFGVQKQLGAGYAVTADYVHIRGKHLPRPFDRNAPDPVTGIRPIAGFGEVYNYDTSGQTWYNAMYLTIEKRFSHGSQFLISDTLSNTKDTLWPLFASQTGAGPQSWSNPDQGEKAYSSSSTSGSNSDSHEPNRLVVNGLQRLPLGFQFSGIFTYFSPRRFNITTGRDNNGDGILADRPNFDPTKVGNARYVDPGTGPGVFGNLPRSAGIWTKSYQVLNLRISKEFKIKERSRLELIMEGFNSLNRVNYSSFTGNIRSALFYQPTGAYDPRQLQFGAKFDF